MLNICCIWLCLAFLLYYSDVYYIQHRDLHKYVEVFLASLIWKANVYIFIVFMYLYLKWQISCNDGWGISNEMCHLSRVQNKEHKVHGRMAKYFNKCLRIIIVYIKIDEVLRKGANYFQKWPILVGKWPTAILNSACVGREG